MLKYKTLSIFIALFIVVELVAYFLLDYQTTHKINSKISNYESRVDDNYDKIYSISKSFVDATFLDIKNIKKIVPILEQADLTEDKNIKSILRDELYNLLVDKYKALNQIGIAQFQFVLNNGESFLRLHEPSAFGDNLLEYRDTFKYVTMHKVPIHTFESGRIFSGYRFVYPLFNDKDIFVGSVEISYKIEHIISHFEQNFYKTLLIEDKTDVTKKLFATYNKNYIIFPLNPTYLIRKDILSNNEQNLFIKELVKNIDKKELEQKLNTKNSFSLYYKDKGNYSVVYFKSLRNYITNEHIGYIILSSRISDLKDYISMFYTNFFILSFLLGTLLIYLYTIRKTKKELKTILSSEKRLLEKVDKYVIYGKSDLIGNILDVSQAFSDVCGYTKKELIGKKFKMLRHPDMPKEVFKDLWETIRAGNIWEREVKNLAKDGSFYWVRLTIQPDFDNNGKIESYTAIAQNISNRKRIESIYRDLRFQVEQYNAIFDNANSGIGRIDLNGIFLKANNNFAELLDIHSDELIGMNFSNFITTKYVTTFNNNMAKVLNGEVIHKQEIACITKKGEKIHLEISLDLLPDKNSLVIIANNLEDKIKLQKSLDFNKTLLYAIPLPIFIQDRDFKLVECNKAFMDFFNLKKEEIIGKKLQQIIGKDIYDLIPKELTNLYKNQDENKIERNLALYQTKIKNWLGAEKTVEIYKTTYNYKNEFNGVIGVLVDISDKEEHTSKLQKTIANKTLENIKQTKEFEKERLKSIKFQAIGQLAAGITHEINTPLTFAKGNLEMMIYDINDLPQSQIKDNLLQDSTSVMGGLNRIANIVESMREMSQQSKEIKEKTNLYSTIIVALTMAYNRAKLITKIYINNKEFEIGMDKNEYMFYSNAQEQRIEQVWVIIINNALDELIKIEPFEKRYIDIKIEEKDGYNIISFRDNAGGIPSEILENLFEPFVSKKDSSGMGIGLNIAKKIINDHDGEIEAYNDEFGAVFEVRLKQIQ
ncbi:PAS domain S-box protein [Arcobacter sp. FWKO B]|uniref:PAS domain S-box protein n=1 Tax=Arcobacter sp. FWKO B TaxID=2593672 RepID=UPI0018A63521|nr:PAS domain S-box protein [Arcobacter sp. FWKO B]QOG12753.1 PAS domain S-box protein [Arcobacter sp. FWKO B]